MFPYQYSVCLVVCFLGHLSADAPGSVDSFFHDSVAEPEGILLEEKTSYLPPLTSQEPVTTKKPELVEAPFSPFTGKIKGRNVRVRLEASIDSRIVQELPKNELVAVIGQKGNFWMIEPTSQIKAYVFRSFILDDTVEGARVNVRLQPNLEAPIIGHLNAGDKVQGVIAASNQKWLEIAPPKTTHFYVSKDFIEYAGGMDLKAEVEKRQLLVEKLLDDTALLSKQELRKPLEEIDLDRVAQGYNTVISDYSDLPEYVEAARTGLALFQEHYLQKRLTHQEMASQPQPVHVVTSEAPKKPTVEILTDKMKIWEPVEQALYLNWASINQKQTQDQFYEEQMLAADTITGIVEPYHSPVKAKPGDFIIRSEDLPIGYVYSTKVNLQKFVGEKVTLKVTPRPNNHFAFPAYYVLSAE